MRNYRQEFSDFSPLVYLDCSYQGPFPRVTVERIHQAIELKSHPDRLKAPEYFGLPARVRARIARLTGADAGEIAITTSATQGIGIAAAGLELGAGDEVVVASSNFPSNLFTWLHLRRKGVTVKVIHPAARGLTLDQVAAELTSRTARPGARLGGLFHRLSDRSCRFRLADSRPRRDIRCGRHARGGRE